MEEPKTQQFRIRDLVLPEWFTSEDRSFLIRCYEIQLAPEIKVGEIIDFPYICTRVLVLNAEFKYFPKPKLFVSNDGSGLITDIHSRKEQIAPKGNYLILLTPYQKNEYLVEQSCNTAIGLMTTFNGRNIAYRHIFDSTENLDTQNSTITSPTIVNPYAFREPNIAHSYIEIMRQSTEIISKLPQEQQNKINLSLQWFSSALRDEHVNAFLKYWIALETLSESDKDDVFFITTTLSKIYKLQKDEVKNKFLIGRLVKLRGNIVHSGHITILDTGLLDYLEGLYADVLFEHLGLPSENRAIELINTKHFNLSECLNKLLKKDK